VNFKFAILFLSTDLEEVLVQGVRDEEEEGEAVRDGEEGEEAVDGVQGGGAGEMGEAIAGNEDGGGGEGGGRENEMNDRVERYPRP
jgi:hypothetical protein